MYLYTVLVTLNDEYTSPQLLEKPELAEFSCSVNHQQKFFWAYNYLLWVSQPRLGICKWEGIRKRVVCSRLGSRMYVCIIVWGLWGEQTKRMPSICLFVSEADRTLEYDIFCFVIITHSPRFRYQLNNPPPIPLPTTHTHTHIFHLPDQLFLNHLVWFIQVILPFCPIK